MYVPPKKLVTHREDSSPNYQPLRPHTRKNYIQTIKNCVEKENHSLREKLKTKETECHSLSSDLCQAKSEIDDIINSADKIIQKIQQGESDKNKYENECQGLRARLKKAAIKQDKLLETLREYEPKSVKLREDCQRKNIERIAEDLKILKQENHCWDSARVRNTQPPCPKVKTWLVNTMLVALCNTYLH